MIRSLEPRALTALAVFATSLTLFGFFTVYGPADAALLSGAERGVAMEVASWFLDLLGVGAYVLVLIPLIWSVHVYFKESTPDLHLRAVGTLMLTASTSAVIGVMHLGESSFWAGSVGSAYYDWVNMIGGIVGPGLGYTLGWSLAIFFFLYSLVLATDWIFHSVLRAETRPVLAVAAAVEVEEASYELLGEDDPAAPRTYIAAASATAIAEHEPQADEALAEPEPTVPDGWSVRSVGERTVLQAPSGYQGVEFLSPSDEFAEPERLYREPEDIEDNLMLGTLSPAFEDDVLFGDTVTTDPSERPTEEVDLTPVVEALSETDADPEPEVVETPASATIGFPEHDLLDDDLINVDMSLMFSHVAGVDLGDDGPTDGASAMNELTETFARPAVEPLPEPEPIEAAAEEPVIEPVAEATQTETGEEPRSTYVDDLFFSPLPEYLLDGSAPAPEAQPEPLPEAVEDERPMEEAVPAAPLFDAVPMAIEKRGLGPLAEHLDDIGLDPLFRDSVDAILTRGRASAVVLQSQLGIGYSRANRILDQMTEVGLTGPEEPTGSRELRLSEDALREFLEATAD